ncbi:hypothetical protein BGZ83_003789 [Gryganskiella cystojenkinii]|nr:hypothetical protein BGZ83_003789 [Gryganskiella cystojenkinii]
MDETMSTTSETTETPISPLELPEILALIVAYLDNASLTQASRVSHAFHQLCTPHLWRDISLTEADNAIWKSDKGFRLGFIRYGRLISTLALQGIAIQDGDLELIAENCIRLKSLDLTGTNVTVETLRVLIHGDPYGIEKKSRHKTGKRKRSPRATVDSDDEVSGDGSEDDQERETEEDSERQTDGDVRGGRGAPAKKYRGLNPLTETETEQEPDSQYESFGPGPSTATESEQEPLAAGPIIMPPRRRVVISTPSGSPGGSPSLMSGGTRIVEQEVPAHRRAGATRPAKFKGIKTVFPYHLETLILNRCNNLVGTTCLPVVALLGPQLQCLQLKHLSDTTDGDLIALMKACPNLKQLMLKGTEISDAFLIECATGTRNAAAIEHEGDNDRNVKENGRTATYNHAGEGYGIQKLNIDMTETTGEGLAAFIQGSRDDLQSLACQHHNGVNEELLTNFFKRDPSVPTTLLPNFVLTEINLSFCASLESAGIHTLFRHAIALQHIVFEASEALDDHALWILAKVQRQRLTRLGLGVPEAWRDHVKAEQKRLAAIADSEGPDQRAWNRPESQYSTDMREQEARELRDEALLYDGSEKVIQGDFKVAGGLRTLNLRRCSRIQNRGIRAIVRSCVGLEHLDLFNCDDLSVQFFNGPWAVGAQLEFLNVSAIPLCNDNLRNRWGVGEEEQELTRFPQQRISSRKEDEWEDFVEDDEENTNDDSSDKDKDDEGNISDDSSSLSMDGFLSKDGRFLKYLRSFYGRLGRLSGLRQLHMAHMPFQFREYALLDLLLPGLQRNLEFWDMEPEFGDAMNDKVLAFIGCHFGRGLVYPEGARPLSRLGSSEDEEEEEGEEEADIAVKDRKFKTGKKDKRSNDDEEDDVDGLLELEFDEDADEDEDEEKGAPFEDFHWKPRVACLKTLRLSEDSLREVDGRLLEWFELQGFDVEAENDEEFLFE